MFSFEIHPYLRNEIRCVSSLLRGYRLEVECPRRLKGKEASLQEVERITELALNPEEICEVD